MAEILKSQEIDAIKVRIESLSANRNLFAILFTIESAILTLIVNQLLPLLIGWRLFLTVLLFASTIVAMLLGIFALTDSIHAYSKYSEYSFMWNSNVHYQFYREKYEPTRPESEIIKDRVDKALWNALEADDYGYYCMKIGVLSFLLSLASFVTIAPLGFLIFLVTAFVITYLMIKTYMRTHQRNSLWEAAVKFFIREPIIRPKRKEESIPKP